MRGAVRLCVLPFGDACHFARTTPAEATEKPAASAGGDGTIFSATIVRFIFVACSSGDCDSETRHLEEFPLLWRFLIQQLRMFDWKLRPITRDSLFYSGA
jgi:hypothetical protein